jgi:hypothetical protein
LCGLGKEFVREFTQPSFKHGADDINVVQVVLLEEIDVQFYIALIKGNNPIRDSAYLHQTFSATS